MGGVAVLTASQGATVGAGHAVASFRPKWAAVASQSRKHRPCDVCGKDGVPVQVGRGNQYKRHVECRAEHRRRSQRADYEANPRKYRWKTRALQMGISVTELEALYERANWACEMCGTPESDLVDRYGALCIDHDHNCCPKRPACGKCVRGLLCPPCNKFLTLADSVSLEAIARYLGFDL